MTKSQKNNKQIINKFARYTSLAFEMGIIIFAGAFVGNWLDKKYNLEKPYFTMILSLIAIFVSLFLIIKQLKNEKK